MSAAHTIADQPLASDAPADDRLDRAEVALGVRFRNRDLLRQALTHRSYSSDPARESALSNERLEFLGDALLDFLVADDLFTRFPDVPEGDLTDGRAALVRADTLAYWARQLDLGPLLYLAPGNKPEELSDRVLSNAFEAVLAAIYCDAGLATARRFLRKRLVGADAIIERLATENYKGRLQELVQDPTQVLPMIPAPPGSRTPSYVIVARGPHATATAFTVEVRVEGYTLGTGQGFTKRLAEQASARDALTRLNAECGVRNAE